MKEFTIQKEYTIVISFPVEADSREVAETIAEGVTVEQALNYHEHEVDDEECRVVSSTEYGESRHTGHGKL